MYFAEQDQYEKKALFKYLVILGIWTALWKVTRGYIVAVVPIYLLTLIAQKKSVETFFWMLALIVPSIGNPLIYPSSSVATLVTRATLMCMSLLLMASLLGRQAPAILRPMQGIFLYLGWEALISLQGYSPVISYLKLLLFVPLYFAFYAIACDVTNSPQANSWRVRAAVLSVCILFIGGSMVLTRIPSIGQMVAMRQTLVGEDVVDVVQTIASDAGMSLFCGMTAQSQALGPVIALMSTLLFADYVLSIRRWDWVYLVLLLCCPILIYKTSSRTAMGAYVAGMGFVVFLFMQAHAVGQQWKGKVLMTVFVLGVLACGAGIAVPSVRERALGYVLKVRGEGMTKKDLTVENVTSSRQALIDASLAGFRKKPLQGNGFQVDWRMEHEHRSGLLSYISAPIEKGVWPTAVLEEGGFIGLVLFAGFLLLAIPTLIKRHAYCGACVLWTFTFANLGEFTFFTMSYLGGFGWTMVFTGLILDGQRLKDVGFRVFEFERFQS